MSDHLSANQVSLRLSCNRCRIQKLKCTIDPSKSSADKACYQRCIRASVDCVFGRRTKSKRNSTILDSQASDKRTSAMMLPDGSTVVQSDRCSDLNNGQNSCDETPSQNLPTTAETDFALYSVTDHLQLDLEAASEIEVGNNDPILCFDFPSWSLEDDIRIFSSESGLLSPESDRAGLAGHKPLTPALAASRLSSSQGSSAISGSHEISSQPAATKLLLSLATKLQERLETLETSTWQQREIWHDLDQYPIGSVLHLCREFVDLGTALRRFRYSNHLPSHQREFQSSSYPICFPEAHSQGFGQETTLPTNSISHSDTSITLILLSCYVTLTRIGTTVLGHFYHYLNTRIYPDEMNSGRGYGLHHSPSTRLGELSPASETYIRIHMAINLLLESLELAKCASVPAYSIQPIHTALEVTENRMPDPDFKSLIESQIGRDKRTAPLYWGLMESATGVQSAFIDLEEKAAELKSLLQAKMGF